jgi:hypothetical protein
MKVCSGADRRPAVRRTSLNSIAWPTGLQFEPMNRRDTELDGPPISLKQG